MSNGNTVNIANATTKVRNSSDERAIFGMLNKTILIPEHQLISFKDVDIAPNSSTAMPAKRPLLVAPVTSTELTCFLYLRRGSFGAPHEHTRELFRKRRRGIGSPTSETTPAATIRSCAHALEPIFYTVYFEKCSGDSSGFF
jgi:hypothetical protein